MKKEAYNLSLSEQCRIFSSVSRRDEGRMVRKTYYVKEGPRDGVGTLLLAVPRKKALT